MNKISLGTIDYFKWSSVIFSLSFSFGLAVNSIAYVMLLVVGIGYAIFDFRRNELKINIKVLNTPLILLFAYIMFREVFANNDTLELLIKYSALLLIPLIFALNSERLKTHIPLIVKAFFVGCVINMTFNWFYAVYRGILINEEGINFWYFTYNFFAEPFGIQPIYLALFYVFAVFILFYYHKLIKSKPLFYCVVFVICTSILLLSARNALLCLFLYTPILLILEKKIAWKKVLIVIAIFGACFVLAVQNPVVKNRIFKVNKQGNFFSGTSLRLNIWKSAVEVSRKNFVWGNGEKKGKKLLINEFKKRKMILPVRQGYNAHNQYLQTLVSHGFFGLILFIYALFIPFKQFLVTKNYLALFWVLLFATTAITESVLMRKWGLMSFVFFTSLFLMDSLSRKVKKEL